MDRRSRVGYPLVPSIFNSVEILVSFRYLCAQSMRWNFQNFR